MPPPARPSRRMRLAVALCRRIVRPRLAATTTPAVARRDFEIAARLVFRAPPFVAHTVAAGRPSIHWVQAGRTVPGRVLLYFHGGAYLTGSPCTHAALAGRLSALTGLAVAMPAYRLAPEHPAPAAFEDACAAHAALLARGYRPQDMVLGGDSAGGGLALALLSRLCVRGQRPAGLFAFSPWVDLTFSGESARTNAARDPLLPPERIAEVVGMVCGALPLEHPSVSPLFAEYPEPPPARIFAGSTEILRSDAERIVARLRAAQGAAALSLWPDAPHAWPLMDGWLPESRSALLDVADFVAGLWLPVAGPAEGLNRESGLERLVPG